MGLRWAAHFCSQAKFVVRVDDDVFLNVETLTRFLRGDEGGIHVGGKLYHGGNLEVIR